MTPNSMSPDLLEHDEVELEPTRIADGDGDAATARAESPRAAAGLATSFGSDTTNLLRSRLAAVAGIVGLFFMVRYVFSLFVPDSGEGLAGSSFLARSIFSFAVLMLLRSRQTLSLPKLRAIEYVFFGLQTLAIVYTQYWISGVLIDRGDAVAAVSFGKNGVIRILVLMLVYGVLIPNDPKVAARAILTMALGPFIVQAILAQAHADSPAVIHQIVSGEYAVSNTIFVVMGAVLAIFASYLVNYLRRDLHDAKRLGQYQLCERIGGGGMGEVYVAEHQLLKRPCALKLINADRQTNPIAIARFEREVQSAAKLSHPNTIEIFDYGRTGDGTFYYVMEYLPGLSLADLVRQFGRLPASRAVYLARQVCKSLAEAHCQGMVHRDLKPGNIHVAIMGGECDVAKVLDFGLVKVTTSPDSPQLTADFTVSGTPAFMSPEQAKGVRDIDGRADIYAVGAILYFMLTGKAPFEKETPVAIMVAHASEPVVPPSKMGVDVPADLESMILKCLAKSPADRYSDARELAAALASSQCAGDWDDARAEQWWLEQANKQTACELAAAATPSSGK
jgi:eukaryotic-like serine/threonine-protein kinase